MENTNEYEIKLSVGLDGNPDAAKIRKAVFCDEQGFKNEFDEIDKTAFHIVLYKDGVPAATGRLFLETGDEYIGLFGGGAPVVMRLGRLAVTKSFRGSGLGAAAAVELERIAAEKGAAGVVLSAQTQAMGFYKKLGYIPVGEEYLEEFCPHITMIKNLA